MRPIPSKKNPDRVLGFEMTESEYQSFCNEYQGLCMYCGETKDCVEPDAEKYECECCERETVYGTEQLMMYGRIKIVDEQLQRYA